MYSEDVALDVLEEYFNNCKLKFPINECTREILWNYLKLLILNQKNGFFIDDKEKNINMTKKLDMKCFTLSS